jgi:hypothetical protein
MTPQPSNPKLTQIIDHGLDAQHQAEFAVYLKPVVLHAVFDPSYWPVILLTVGQHLAVKPWV